jgi:hypothetical protein
VYPSCRLTAGTHTIHVSVAPDANYNAAIGAGTLSIAPTTAATISFAVSNHTYSGPASAVRPQILPESSNIRERMTLVAV